MADYDITIAGGGPVGSALALALADGRRRIAVVEARAELPREGTRTIVLAAGSVRLLRALGAWHPLAATAVPVHRVEVSQRGWPGRTRIDSDTEGVEALGQVVPYGALARVLAELAQAAPGVDWLAPASVVNAVQASGHIELQLRSGGRDCTRAAALAIAADGTDSPLRTALGVPVRVRDYHQVALVLEIAVRGDAGVAHERFTADGTLALLPRGGDHRTLVWALAATTAEHFAAMSVGELAAAIGERLGPEFGVVEIVEGPERYPLKRTEAEWLVAGRGVVVGNAARTLHPVAAQGFNLALRDACALAERLAPVADPGAATVLAEWDRARRLDRWLTRDFTDVLARGFGHGSRLLAPVRAGALLGVDLFPPARGLLAAQTMGLAGGLPRVGNWRPEADS